MQRSAPRRTSKSIRDDVERCPECGKPIQGIEAAGPAGHRFAGCGHRASERFLRRTDDRRLVFAGVS